MLATSDRETSNPQVELHHKKQQQSPSKSSTTTAPTAKVAPISVTHQPQRLSQQIEEAKEVSQILSQKKQNTKSEASETGSSKKNSPVHEKKERRVFSKKELRELINQIEQRELPADMGEETVQVSSLSIRRDRGGVAGCMIMFDAFASS